MRLRLFLLPFLMMAAFDAAHVVGRVGRQTATDEASIGGAQVDRIAAV